MSEIEVLRSFVRTVLFNLEDDFSCYGVPIEPKDLQRLIFTNQGIPYEDVRLAVSASSPEGVVAKLLSIGEGLSDHLALDLGHRTTDFLRVRGVAGSDKLAITPRYKSVEGLLELETKRQNLIAQGRLDPKSRPRILFRKEED